MRIQLYSSLLCCMILVGCFQTTDQERKSEQKSLHTVKIAAPFDPGTVDPRKIRDLSQVAISKTLFSGLTSLSNTVVTNDLMESITFSEDGLSAHIILKHPLFWSDGSPITAYDVQASWLSSLDPKECCPNVSLLFVFKNGQKYFQNKIDRSAVGITVLDQNTMDIQLEYPCLYFQELLATYPFFILPKSWLEKPTDVRPVTPPSYGPFVLEKWVPQDRVVVAKNSRYHNSKAIAYDSIEFHIVSEQTALAMFEQGQIDLVGSPLSTLPLDFLKYFQDRAILHITPAAATSFFRIQTKNEKLSDHNFRKALSESIDRKALSEHVLQFSGDPAYQLAPPFMILHSMEPYFLQTEKSAPQYTLPKSISITYQATDRNSRIVQACQQSFKSAFPKMDIILEPCESQHFYSKIRQGDYELALGGWVCDFFDADSFYSIFQTATTGTNNTGWYSPEYSQWLQISGTSKDQEKRIEARQHMEKILFEEAPIIPLFHNKYCFLKSAHGKNVHVSPMGTFDYVIHE